MLEMHDDGTIGYGTQPANNPFDYLDGEYATSQRFPAQHGPRCGRCMQLPWGIQHERHLLLRLGQPLRRQHRDRAVRQAGHQPPEPDGRRRRVAGDHHPGGGRSIGWNGPAVDQRRATSFRATRSKGCRCTRSTCGSRRTSSSAARRKVQLDRARCSTSSTTRNYGSYNTSLSATAAATTALFGTPNQNTGNAYVSRQAQLGFKVQF